MSTSDFLSPYKRRQSILADSARSAYDRFVDEYRVGRSGITRTELRDRLDRFDRCATILEERDYDDGERGVHAGNYCHMPSICPVCSRVAAEHRRVHWRVPLMEAADRYDRAYLITFTLANQTTLSTMFDHLTDSLRRFRLMGQRRRGGRSLGEWGKVRAGITGIEIKRGSGSGDWHCHGHAIVFTDEMIDYRLDGEVSFRGRNVHSSKISREWLAATGDSMGIDVRPLRRVPRGVRDPGRYRKMSRAESIAYQAREVLKYAVKIATLEPVDTLYIMDAVYNRRFFRSSGAFFGMERYRCDSCGRHQTSVGRPSGVGACPDCGSDMRLQSVSTYRGDDVRPHTQVYCTTWDNAALMYMEPRPVPSPMFEDDESAKYEDLLRRTRQRAAEILGRYRRLRTSLIRQRAELPEAELESRLDLARVTYKEAVAEAWRKMAEYMKEAYQQSRSPRGAGGPWPMGPIFAVECWSCGHSTDNLGAPDDECPRCGGVLIRVAPRGTYAETGPP